MLTELRKQPRFGIRAKIEDQVPEHVLKWARRSAWFLQQDIKTQVFNQLFIHFITFTDEGHCGLP